LAAIVPNVIANKPFADDNWKSYVLFIAGPIIFVVLAVVLILDINFRLKAGPPLAPPVSNPHDPGRTTH